MFHFLPSIEVMLNLCNVYANTLVKSLDLWSWQSLNRLYKGIGIYVGLKRIKLILQGFNMAISSRNKNRGLHNPQLT